MRVHLHGDREPGAFAEMLINVGDGKANIVQQPDMVRVAGLGYNATSVDDLIDKVFPNFQENVVESDRLSKRGILAPLNESVTKINSKLIDNHNARIFKTLQVHQYCCVRRRGNPLSTRLFFKFHRDIRVTTT